MTEQEWLACEDPAAMLEAVTIDSPHRPTHKGIGAGRRQLISDRKLRLFAQNLMAILLVEPTGEGYPNHPIDWLQGFLGLPGEMRYGKDEAALLRDIVGNPWRPVTLVAVKPGDRLTLLTRPYRLALAGPDDSVAATVVRVHGRQMTVAPTHAPTEQGVWNAPLYPWLDHNDGAVRKLAQAIHDGRRWEELPILRDALIEAGCDNDDLLRHLDGQERCPRCNGSGKDFVRSGGYFAACVCDWASNSDRVAAGWIKSRGPHVRGCWVLDLLLEKP